MAPSLPEAEESTVDVRTIVILIFGLGVFGLIITSIAMLIQYCVKKHYRFVPNKRNKSKVSLMRKSKVNTYYVNPEDWMEKPYPETDWEKIKKYTKNAPKKALETVNECYCLQPDEEDEKGGGDKVQADVELQEVKKEKKEEEEPEDSAAWEEKNPEPPDYRINMTTATDTERVRKRRAWEKLKKDRQDKKIREQLKQEALERHRQRQEATMAMRRRYGADSEPESDDIGGSLTEEARNWWD